MCIYVPSLLTVCRELIHKSLHKNKQTNKQTNKQKNLYIYTSIIYTVLTRIACGVVNGCGMLKTWMVCFQKTMVQSLYVVTGECAMLKVVRLGSL